MTKTTKKNEIATVKKLPKGWKVRKDTSTRADGTVWISNGKSFFDKKYQQKLLIVDKGAFKEAQKRKKFKQTTYTDATGRAVTGKIVSDYKDKDGVRRTVTKGYNGKYSANFNGASIHGFATKAEAEKVLKKIRPTAVNANSKSKVIVKPVKKVAVSSSKKVVQKKYTNSKIRAGEYANINAESAHGHLGVVTKRYKNGKMDAVTTTHSEKYPKHKKIKLEENPNPKERGKTSYLNKRVHKNVTDKDIGTRRPNVRIKNAVDKSKLRKIKTITKRKK